MKEVVPEDMNIDVSKLTSAGSTGFGLNQFGGPSNFPVGEGRVHGGSHFIKVSSVLGASSSSSNVGVKDASIEPMKSYIIPQNWM